MPLDTEPTCIVSTGDFELTSRARAGQASETFAAQSRGVRALGNGGETRGIAKRDLLDVHRQLGQQAGIAANLSMMRLLEIRRELQEKLATVPESAGEEREKLEGQIRYIDNKARNDEGELRLNGFQFNLPDYKNDETLLESVGLENAMRGLGVTAMTAVPLVGESRLDPDTLALDLGREDLHLLSRAVASSTLDQLLGTHILSQEKFGVDGEGNPMGISVEVDGVGVMGNLENGKIYFLDTDYASPSIQKGLYDLEALDYITGQIDRHAGNIFIDPETGEVRGIDNDLAFPEISRSEMLGMQGAPSFPVRSLPRYMPEDTAGKIESLRPEDLRNSLSCIGYPPDGDRGKLKPQEIDGAVERLKELQNHIQTLRGEGRVVRQFTQDTYDEAVRHQEEVSLEQMRRMESFQGMDVSMETVTGGHINSTARTSYVGTVALEKRVNEKNVAKGFGEKLDFGSLKEALGTSARALRDPEQAEFARLVEERRQETRAQLTILRTPQLSALKNRLGTAEKQLRDLEEPGLGTKIGAIGQGGVDAARRELQQERMGILQDIRDIENGINVRVEEILDEQKVGIWEKAQEYVEFPDRRVGPKPVGQPDPHYGSFSPFIGKEVVGAGGATGSGRVKVDGQNYQLKGSIEHSSLKRRFKSGGLNHENYGEVIASNISRALVGEDNRRYIPEVQIRQDKESHEPKVTSEYLEGGRGDLDDLYRFEMAKIDPSLNDLPKDSNGKTPITDSSGRPLKHARITLKPDGETRPGVLKLDGLAAQDVRRNIALSALMGDHDVNPGNMIAVEGGRVGRIDFGHAFNELITGMGGTMTGGGGVRFQKNRILDFFNREKVSGAQLGGDPSKLWRDYEGIEPSPEMVQALREIGSSTESLDGLAHAKTQFLDLIADLELEGTPEALKEIEDIANSLARVSENIGKPITSTEPNDMVRDVFQNLDSFVREGQKQMNEVADLCSLQSRIDIFLRDPANEGQPLPEDITSLYNLLVNKPDSTVKATQGEGLQWMKNSKGSPAFSGDLDSFVKGRRQVVRLERAEGPALNEIERLETRKAQLQNSPTAGDHVKAFFKHGLKGIGGEIDSINKKVETLRTAVREVREGVTVEDDRTQVQILKESDRQLKEEINNVVQERGVRYLNGVNGISEPMTREDIDGYQGKIEDLQQARRDVQARIKQEEGVISVREKLGLKYVARAPLQVQEQPVVDDLFEDLEPELQEVAPERRQSVREALSSKSNSATTEVEAPTRKMNL